MKNLACIPLLALCLFMGACKKGSNNAAPQIDTLGMANGCISRATYSTASTIQSIDLATTLQLFSQNNISTSGLNFFRFNHDTTTKYYLPGQYIFINAGQYY